MIQDSAPSHKGATIAPIRSRLVVNITKGTTAKDIAARAGHHFLVTRLDQALNKSNAA